MKAPPPTSIRTFYRPRQHCKSLKPNHVPARQLTLAYSLHPAPTATARPNPIHAPVIFLHGLFGSKQNNKSMSKSVQALCCALVRRVTELVSQSVGKGPGR